MTIEDAYILYLKETMLHFTYRFGASIKENGCTQPTIGKYNIHISEMQFLCIAKRISK
jgi:hypothetical protein